jgi:hypothetical protein
LESDANQFSLLFGWARYHIAPNQLSFAYLACPDLIRQYFRFHRQRKEMQDEPALLTRRHIDLIHVSVQMLYWIASMHFQTIIENNANSFLVKLNCSDSGALCRHGTSPLLGFRYNGSLQFRSHWPALLRSVTLAKIIPILPRSSNIGQLAVILFGTPREHRPTSPEPF